MFCSVEVPGVCTVYSPGPNSFMIDSERSGKCCGSAVLRRARKSASARESGWAGSCSPSSFATSIIPGQCSGVRTTRRSDSAPLAVRNCAIATFAAIMKFSMRSRALFRSTTESSVTRPLLSITGEAWIVSNSSAPCSFRNSRRCWAASNWSLICASIFGTLATSGGIGPVLSSQAPTASYESLA